MNHIVAQGDPNSLVRKVQENPAEFVRVFELMRLAVQSQADISDMQREGSWTVAPSDPRYTPVIGEWDGYTAPELRFAEFATRRRMLRGEAIIAAAQLVPPPWPDSLRQSVAAMTDAEKKRASLAGGGR